MRNKNKQGFTLIELLVVVAIIGLLSSIVLISLNTARAKARDAKRLADVRQIAGALELYYNDCGGYPILAATNLGDGTARLLQAGSGTAVTAAAPCGANDGSGATPNGAGGIRTANGGAGTVYLGAFPRVPTPFDTPCTALNNTYTYTAGGVTTYTLTFCLGAATGGLGSGAHTLSPNGIN